MYEIKTTGSGTIPELVKALHALISSLENDNLHVKGGRTVTFEDETLCTELTEQ